MCIRDRQYSVHRLKRRVEKKNQFKLSNHLYYVIQVPLKVHSTDGSALSPTYPSYGPTNFRSDHLVAPSSLVNCMISVSFPYSTESDLPFFQGSWCVLSPNNEHHYKMLKGLCRICQALTRLCVSWGRGALPSLISLIASVDVKQCVRLHRIIHQSPNLLQCFSLWAQRGHHSSGFSCGTVIAIFCTGDWQSKTQHWTKQLAIVNIFFFYALHSQ